MAAASQTTPQRRPGFRRRLSLASAAISAALLGSYFFVEMNNPTEHARWRWVLGVAVLLTVGVLVFRRDRLRSVFVAPLIGLFLGMVVVLILGATAAGVEWLATAGVPTASLRSAVLASLPGGAVAGAVLGLMGWLVLRLIRYRATAAANQPRARVQFGLRTLLFAVFCVAGLLWTVTPAQRNYERQRAVSRLVAAGARVNVNAQKTVVCLYGATATDEDLQSLHRLPELSGLSLECPRVTERGLAHLQGLQALQTLHLSYTGRGGLEVLGSLPR